MKWYLFLAKWISVQVGRLLHTKDDSSFINLLHVPNQNRPCFKTPAQKPAQNAQRSQSGYENSVFNASYLVRESTAQRYPEGATVGGLFWYFASSTSFRSARHKRRITRRPNPKQTERLFQRNFRNYCQTSRIDFNLGKVK